MLKSDHVEAEAICGNKTEGMKLLGAHVSQEAASSNSDRDFHARMSYWLYHKPYMTAQRGPEGFELSFRIERSLHRLNQFAPLT